MELSTRYDPAEHEQATYQAWLDSGAFAPPAEGEGSGRPFTIAIPPPNVTGVLHMGHALNGTVQDILMRHRRMAGYDALWIPGTDHAGIATQAVVERKLFQEGKEREAMGREAFVGEIWKWKEEHGDIILKQFQRLGCSCDWSRTRFTLEPSMSRAVREAFVRLWERGLVYRGARMVNWDCKLQTAISDDEVDYETRKSKLWTLRYPVKGEEGTHICVATTRPETMLGDTGVAVHPDDERYGGLVGKTVVLPLVGREIPIVADDTVDPKFGTGAVKLTPGHDPADYERGARHKLPLINILEKDGTLNEEAGAYAGLNKDEARKRVVADLEEQGLLEKVDTITNNVSISDRSKTPIEPLISEQWFVKMEPLAQPAIQAAKSGRLQFRPERWTKVYLDWLENVQDWCISRQLWWGHRIPVWYDEDGTPIASRDDIEIGSPHPQTGKPIVRQDEDVLDTWASSWLWPFATLGWPDKTPDLSRFYPTQFLSTARDIIYLWVARMVMAGYAFLDDLPEDERCPFSVVNVHATVQDAKGRRMSKSAGNGVDPLDMIAKFGADAVRYSLISLTREGQDVRLSEDRFEEGRRFANKVWNATRFVCMNLEGERGDGSSASAATLEDRWILSRLAAVRAQVSDDLENYRLNDAVMALRQFFWNDYCDWYVELAKPRLSGEDAASARAARGTLARVLKDALRLLHPFVPFQTEVLWKHLHETLGEQGGLLVSAPWPEGEGLEIDEAAVAEMGVLQELVNGVRRIRALTMVDERKPLAALVSAPRDVERSVLERHAAGARALANLETLEVGEALERPPSSAADVAGAMQIYVPLGEDVDLDKLKSTLEGRVQKLEKGLVGIDKKLENQGFVNSAPAEVVEAERARRDELRLELEMLRRNLEGL